MTPKTDIPVKSSRTRNLIGLSTLSALVGIAVYLWSQPARLEYKLSHASLSQLVAQSKKEPDNPRIFYFQGKRLNEINSLGPCYAAWGRAAYLDGDNEDYWLGWGDSAARFHSENEAVSIYETFLLKHPKSAKVHLALANIYQQKKVHFKGYEEAKLAVTYNPNSDEAWRLLGMEALTIDKGAESLIDFQNAVRLNSKSWENQAALGNMLLEGKNYTAAIAAFKETTRLAPNQFIGFLGLGDAQFSSAKTTEEMKEAKASLRHAISLRPDTPAPRLILGQLFMAGSQWLDAKTALLAAEELEPNNPEVHLSLSKVYRKLNDLPAASRESKLHEQKQEYETQKLALGSRTRASNDPLARLQLARLFAKNGDYEQSIDTYQNILSRGADPAIQKELAEVMQHKPEGQRSVQTIGDSGSTESDKTGRALRDADDLMKHSGFKAAEDAYRAALRSEPNSALAYQGLGLALEAQGNQEEAFPFLQTAVRLNPKLDKAENSLAKIYYSLGFADEAGKRMAVVTKQHPENAGYWFSLGMYYGGFQFHYAEALKAFQKAVELKPSDSQYCQTLADMHLKIHQVKEAESNYRLANRLNPKDPGTLFGLGKFLAEHGTSTANENEAYELLSQVNRAAPNFPPVLFQLGKIELKRGNIKQAIVQLEASATANPDYETLYTLSRAYSLDHQEANARAATEAAVKKRDLSFNLTNAEDLARQSKKDYKLRLNLARLYSQSGQHAKAINQYEVCINLTSDNSKIKNELNAYKEKLTKSGQMPSMKLFNGMVTAVVPPAK